MFVPKRKIVNIDFRNTTITTKYAFVYCWQSTMYFTFRKVKWFSGQYLYSPKKCFSYRNETFSILIYIQNSFILFPLLSVYHPDMSRLQYFEYNKIGKHTISYRLLRRWIFYNFMYNTFYVMFRLQYYSNLVWAVMKHSSAAIKNLAWNFNIIKTNIEFQNSVVFHETLKTKKWMSTLLTLRY